MAAAKKPAAQADPVTDDGTVRLKIEGKWYEIDPSDLSWGEVEAAEIYFDSSIDDIDFETGRGMMFLCYIARSRVEPAFTIEAMKRLRVSDFEVDQGERPTDSGDADSGTRS